MAFLRHEGRRGERQGLRRARADEHWDEGGLIGEGLALGAWPGETGVAMHGFGRKGGGDVPGRDNGLTGGA